MTQGEQQPPQEENPEQNLEFAEGAAEFYCDSFQITTGLWGATLYMGELRAGEKALVKAKIKVSPQMLRAISLLSGKHLRDYEEKVGPVALPKPMLHAWGLEEEIQ